MFSWRKTSTPFSPVITALRFSHSMELKTSSPALVNRRRIFRLSPDSPFPASLLTGSTCETTLVSSMASTSSFFASSTVSSSFRKSGPSKSSLASSSTSQSLKEGSCSISGSSSSGSSISGLLTSGSGSMKSKSKLVCLLSAIATPRTTTASRLDTTIRTTIRPSWCFWGRTGKS
ncbi:MAG: hypothetical protein BWX66_00277 [Deltaproteobacteria bacterium ADurb.Bin058]|nr:MAG: hypothetical protein BWX66_00277 [Deltaproteobacteria bacterium ADurb.Bin058]